MRGADSTSPDYRRNIRHASCLPIECRRDGANEPHASRLANIGHGGLGLVSTTPLNPGDVYRFDFPGLGYDGEVRGEVVWSKRRAEHADAPYVAGVRFIEEGPYTHARLVVDVCHLEFFRRRESTRTGRKPDYTEALTAWQQQRGA